MSPGRDNGQTQISPIGRVRVYFVTLLLNQRQKQIAEIGIFEGAPFRSQQAKAIKTPKKHLKQFNSKLPDDSVPQVGNWWSKKTAGKLLVTRCNSAEKRKD
jgi:hypothetical protein